MTLGRLASDVLGDGWGDGHDIVLDLGTVLSHHLIPTKESLCPAPPPMSLATRMHYRNGVHSAL